MAFKAKLSLAILLLSVLVLCVVAVEDPELKQCKYECRQQPQFDEEQQQECEKKCEKYYKQKERESKEGGRDGNEWWNENEQEQEEKNPYVFKVNEFYSVVKTEHGRIDLLPKFPKRSWLLRGLENYRVAALVTNPQTFVIQNHCDADGVYFVAKGRATISMVRENKRESYNLEYGDLIAVPSGTPVYIINRDEKDILYIIKLFQPVNIPDEFQAFFGPGGENPESFFRAFSWEVLEAAFNTERRRLEKLFGQQKQGSILKASKEQIKAMSQQEGGGSIWPFPVETSRGPFKLFKQPPSQSNDYGKLFQVEPHEYRPLEDLNVMVSYANITEGAMVGPYYNSKATKICMVMRKEGYFEMACPHISSSGPGGKQQGGGSSRRRESGPSYQKISSELKAGDVFIVPAGHPVVTVASKNNNLQILCFEVNAHDNYRHPLAGQGNIIKLMEKEAKELSFNTKAQEVDQVFGKQDKKFFFPGPSKWEQQKQGGGGRAYE